jgi:hypothetical protein
MTPAPSFAILFDATQHRGFGLYQSAEAAEEAADILTVKCPMCGETGTYQKNEIQILVGHRRQ